MLSIQSLKRELLLLILMLFIGALILPIAVYAVGNVVFGEYAGDGFSHFYRTIHSDFRNGLFDGHWVVVFLVLSPYLLWQSLRLTAYLFKRPAEKV